MMGLRKNFKFVSSSFKILVYAPENTQFQLFSERDLECF
jgi:hypothetical protein